MNILKHITLCFALLFAIAQEGLAQLRLPNFFSNHMVLQRNTPINFWGWGGAGGQIQVKVSWSQDAITAKVDPNGQWKVVLPAGKAGGPYQIDVSLNGENQTLQDVLLGDVFLCSGQSNMEWGGNQNLKEIIDELPSANNPNIRLLQVSRAGAGAAQEQLPNSWTALNAETLKPFSAIGYFIAKEINAKENIPIGVINSSWGGTPAEVWTPSYLINHDPLLLEKSKMQGVSDYRPNQPGVLWNGMISPFVGYNLTAAFWYQGESNVGSWQGYDKLMKTMVNAWRSAWNHDFPFYFVQIAPYTYNNQAPLAAYLREQQAKTALELRNTGMVVVTDLVDNIKDIHPTQKREVALRLSEMALVDIYKHNIKDYKSPIYQSSEVKGNSIVVTFYNLDGNLKANGDITDLQIAGADKVFHAAKGSVKGNKLIIQSSEVKNPVAVRFGFSEIAMPNLFNSRGLPVSPFRSDNW